jgi:integrase
VNTMATGRTFRRCGCRDRQTGRRLGGRCPRLDDPEHGSWYLCLELGVGSDGQRCRLRCGGYPSQTEARRALAELGAPSGGGAPGQAGWTTGRWLARWLAGKEGLRPSSARSYRGHVRLYLVPHLGRIPLQSLTPADLQAMFNAIQRQHAAAGHPVSAATLVRIRATLRSALNAAVREQFIADNPARWVQLPQVRRPHPVVWTGARVAAWQATGQRPAVAVWTAQQTAAFLRGIADDPLYGYYHLIALRGLRRGEATGLAWPQVDLDSGEATISQQLQEHSGQPVLLPPKSVASLRTVALDWSTVAALRAHRERQRTEHGIDRPDGFVFARSDGRPYSPGYLTHRFARLVAGLGLPPIRLHDLRHGADPGVGVRGGPQSDPRHARPRQHRAHRGHLHLGPARSGTAHRGRHRPPHRASRPLPARQRRDARPVVARSARDPPWTHHGRTRPLQTPLT